MGRPFFFSWARTPQRNAEAKKSGPTLTLCHDAEGYVLNVGEPYADPPVLTWREHLLMRGEDLSVDMPLLGSD